MVAGICATGLPVICAIFALASSGNTLYAGGSFLSLSGRPRQGLAAISTEGPLLDWNPGTSIENQVFALALSENALQVGGGSGLTFDGTADLHTLASFPRLTGPVITQPPRDQRVPLGQTVEFNVTATGQEPLSYQWQFNGTNLPGETNTLLRLAAVQVAQSGRYQVIVTNSAGAMTAEATLAVVQAPRILVPPAGQTVDPGATVTFSVAAIGSPPPLYQWRLNGVNIPGAVFPTLTLTNVTPVSGGSYQVVVFNGVGVAGSDSVTLLVRSDALPIADP